MITKKIYDDHELLNNPSIYQYYNNTHEKTKRTIYSVKEFVIYMLIAIVEVLFPEISFS